MAIFGAIKTLSANLNKSATCLIISTTLLKVVSSSCQTFKFFVRLHGEYNSSLALWKHRVILLQSFQSVSSGLPQC